MSILCVTAAGVVVSAVAWPVLDALAGRRGQAGSDARTARGIGLLAAFLVIACACGTWTIPSVPLVGAVLTRWFVIGLAGLLSLVAAGMAACTVLAWRQRWWDTLMRTHYTAVTLAAVLLVAAAQANHLLPW